jgi:hypothetical protein
MPKKTKTKPLEEYSDEPLAKDIPEVTRTIYPDGTEINKDDNHGIHGIHAFVIFSESELALVKPDYTTDWADENISELKELLFELGANVNKPIEIQEGLIHRNRMNKVVQCRRYACHERTDKDWLASGYASREAKNKASGNRLIRDMNPYAFVEA